MISNQNLEFFSQFHRNREYRIKDKLARIAFSDLNNRQFRRKKIVQGLKLLIYWIYQFYFLHTGLYESRIPNKRQIGAYSGLRLE